MLKPDSIHIKNNNELLDFIFSIQDFYYYNPRVFIDMVNSINDFMTIRNENEMSNIYNGYLYSSLLMKKRDALNSLASLAISLPSNRDVDEKLQNALERLEFILNNYLDETYYKYRNNIYKNGYRSDIINVDIGYIPKNTYDGIGNSNDLF